MSNVRSVLSIVMLCSIASGSVFLEGMEKLNLDVVEKSNIREVKEVKLILDSGYRPAYSSITEKPSCLSAGCSIKSFSKRYGHQVFKNDLFFGFDVVPIENNKSIVLRGKEATKGLIFDFDFLKKMYLPVRMFFNPNGTLKVDGDIIEKIIFKQELFDIVGRLVSGRFDCAPTLCQAFYDRIEACRERPNYCIGGGNEKALLDEGILVRGPDGEMQHGKNGFDFYQDKIYNLILILIKGF